MTLQQDAKYLIDRANELPEKIRTSEQRILALNRKLEAKSEERKMIELRTFAFVCNEKDPDGKPLYTNEKLREAAQKGLLAENSEYELIDAAEQEIREQVSLEKIELNFLLNSFDAAKITARILGEVYNARY